MTMAARAWLTLALGAALLAGGAAHAQQSGTEGKMGKAKKGAKAQGRQVAGAAKKADVDADVLKLYEPREYKGMPYRVMKPLDYDPAKSYPLILSLHGRGGVGRDNLGNMRMWTGILAREELRRKHPCFVLAPQTALRWFCAGEKAPELTTETVARYSEVWQKFLTRRAAAPEPAGESYFEGDLTKVFELVEEIEQEFPIDRSRVYVLGHSMGGFGSWNAIWEKPELFAAAIPCAGGLMPWKDAKRFAEVPVWAFHGSADATVPVEFTREIFAAVKQLGGNMKYTELKDVGHNVNQFAFDYKGDDAAKGWTTQYGSERCDKEGDVWDWLFKQKRP